MPKSIDRKNLVDILAYLEKEIGIKLKDLNKKEIDELIEALEQLPPDQVIIKIED